MSKSVRDLSMVKPMPSALRDATEAELHPLLNEGNHTSTAYPRDKCIHELFEAQVARTPNTLALTFEGRHLSYQALNRQANQLAHFLRARGIGPETLVGLCAERSLEMIVGLLGILKAGGACVPLDPGYPRQRLALMLEDTRLPLVLTQQALVQHLPDGPASVVCLDAGWEAISSYSDQNLDSQTEATNLACVFYTSGSTGTPKGVSIVHRGVVRLVQQTNYVELGPDEVFLQLAPISFDASTFEIWGCLLNGGRLVIMPAHTPSLEEIGNAVVQNKVTTLWLTSSLFRLMVDTNLESLRGLRQLLTGGDVVPATQARKVVTEFPGIRLINGYGPTESTTFACCYPVTDSRQVQQTLPIGRPIANTQVYVLDEQLQPVTIGTAGELYIGGDGLARGYLHQPQITAEKFIPDPLSMKFGSRLYKTGDSVRRLPDGNLEFLGRLDSQVKINGFRIELAEIEATVNQHPGVRESVVVAGNDALGEKRLVAYLVMSQAQKTPAGLGSVSSLSNARLDQWQKVYDEVIYRTIKSKTSAPSDPQFNITGWDSSYTGRPLSHEEMREQVDQTVDRILALRPRRVLEIGCGTGLLLFRIAPHCGLYLGTDFSEVALSYVKQQLDQLEQPLPQVTLSHRSADDFNGVEAESFDVVILNSVVQHFPDIEYFVQEMAAATSVVRPGGAIFVGDVRSLPLLKAFHTSVQLGHAPSSLSTSQFQSLVRRQVMQEEELVIDPALFKALQRQLPEISRVQIQLKRGRHHNELTRFRYDAVMHIKEESRPPVEIPWLDWSKEALTLAAVTRLIQETRPPRLGIRNVPNARLTTESRAVELLEGPNRPETIGQLREILGNIEGQGIDPEEFWGLAKDDSTLIEIWSSGQRDSCYDVLIRSEATRGVEVTSQGSLSIELAATDRSDWAAYANNPLQQLLKRQSVRQVRNFVKERLPEYMVPAAFVVLDTLPLTSNGKVDRLALPAPEQERPNLSQDYVAPSTPLEQAVTDVWEKVLGIDGIGVNDNFFEIGGNSLKAVQVIAQLRRSFRVELSTTSLFEKPTVSALVDVLRSSTAKAEWQQKVAANRERGIERSRKKFAKGRHSRMRASG